MSTLSTESTRTTRHKDEEEEIRNYKMARLTKRSLLLDLYVQITSKAFNIQ